MLFTTVFFLLIIIIKSTNVRQVQMYIHIDSPIHIETVGEGCPTNLVLNFKNHWGHFIDGSDNVTQHVAF